MMGVDLNRNYGFHYAASQEDEEACSETYRGPFAFSEPETQAIRDLVLSEPTITAAMNFHTYGNMWIHPFNYSKEKGKYPDHLDVTLLDFYEQFKDEVKAVSKSRYGTAIEMVDYATDGEASDWMLGEHNIIAFSPELGSMNDKAQDFFIEKDLIVEVINENYKVIDLFLKRNEFKMLNLAYGFDNKKRFSVGFENAGIAHIYNPIFVLETEHQFFAEAIDKIIVHTRAGEHIKTQISRSDDSRTLTISFEKLLRFQEFKMEFYFTDPTIDVHKFAFALAMKLTNGYVFGHFKVHYHGKTINNNIMVSLLTLVVLCMISLMLILANKVMSKGEASEDRDIENPDKESQGNQATENVAAPADVTVELAK